MPCLGTNALCMCMSEFYQDHASRRSSFPLCGYDDLVVCDVLPMYMHVCSILLEKSWTDRRQLTYHYDGEFSFVQKGRLPSRYVVSHEMHAGYVYLGGRFLCRGIVHWFPLPHLWVMCTARVIGRFYQLNSEEFIVS